MLSPFMTVAVLVVLWLIVVVPMVLRRSDERRRDRSVTDWGRTMRALGRRAPAAASAEVFTTRRDAAAPDARSTPLATPARRPVPAAQEALMYPPDRSELSPARAQMLARRRRSLTTLFAGTAVFALAGLVMGGAMWWLAALFAASLAGYLFFLRSQALRDRSRRENRQLRATSRRSTGYDATAELSRFEPEAPTVVRIDDDDLELHTMDTIDLTGLYQEEAGEPAVQRRAS